MQIDFRMTFSEGTGQLRDLVATGMLDLAVTNFHEPMRGIVAKPLGREQMMLVGPRHAKLSLRVATAVNQLGSLPLILTTRPNSLRLNIEEKLSALGLRPDVRLEANTLPLMTDLVTSGLGYTVLPACGIGALLKNKTVTASPIVGCFLTWVVAKPKMRSLGVAAQTLYNMLCEIGEEKIAEGTWQSPHSRSGRRSNAASRANSQRATGHSPLVGLPMSS